MLVTETKLEVRYYETDLMGIVHHSNYVRFFEFGRHKMLIDAGIPIEKLEELGYMFPVVSVECKYHRPSKMGDILTIVSKMKELPRVKIVVHTEIYNQDNELVSSGKVTLGVIHVDTRKPTRVPNVMLEAFSKYFSN